jgi:hypothetical protein
MPDSGASATRCEFRRSPTADGDAVPGLRLRGVNSVAPSGEREQPVFLRCCDRERDDLDFHEEPE